MHAETNTMDVRSQAERVARQSYGRLLALLATRTSDVAAAEDALADAFAAALTQWQSGDLPQRPEAWILTVARRRLLDNMRRAGTRNAGQNHLKLIAEEIEAAMQSPDDIPDRRLALMCACAHPSIDAGIRAPLILQTVLGLNATEIAAAFLIPPATMGQRLVRAKSRIKQENLSFELPTLQDLPARLDSVLNAIYAIYTKGWRELGEQANDNLVGEALWLARLLADLTPDSTEAKGLLALMLYAEARRPARQTPEGRFVPMDEQDIGLWDIAMIDEAEEILHRASAAGSSGRFQLEAAIQSAHVARLLLGRDNRAEIVQIYDILFGLTRSPVVALNRAVALSEIEGPHAALQILTALADDKRMQGYQPFWAARASLCARADHVEAAYEAFTIAMGLTADPSVRDYLLERRNKLKND